jgi:hypothetical protein
MVNNTPIFSTDAEFEIRLRGGDLYVTRFPTDQEWCDRNRAIKTVIVRAGAGTQTKTEGVENADRELLRKIAKSGAEGVDEYQANVLISKLTKAEAREAVAVPEGYEVTLTVVGGIVTKHTLRVPTEKEIRTYRRGAFVFVDLRHGKQELKTSPAAIGEFYDKLLVKNEGYQGDVPLAHKSSAVIELTQTVDALDEEDTEAFI